MPDHRIAVRALVVGVLVALGACRDQAVQYPSTLATYPHAMDRLAMLMRAEFDSAQPARIEQMIRCESARVERAIGPDFRVRLRLLEDSLHQEFASVRFDRLGRRLGPALPRSSFDPACRAIDEAAERELPLRPLAPARDST